MRPRAIALVLPLLAACGSSYGEENAPSGSTSSSSGEPGKGGTGATSLPGKVECGKDVCDLATTQCCIDNGGGFSCTDKAQPCRDNQALCDEAADCAGGAKCCGTIGFGKFDTVCQSKCDLAQSCRTNAECGSQECIKQSCVGITSWLCGLNPFCQKL